MTTVRQNFIPFNEISEIRLFIDEFSSFCHTLSGRTGAQRTPRRTTGPSTAGVTV